MWGPPTETAPENQRIPILGIMHGAADHPVIKSLTNSPFWVSELNSVKWSLLTWIIHFQTTDMLMWVNT